VTVADSQHTGSSASDASIDSSSEQQRPARVSMHKRVALLPVNIAKAVYRTAQKANFVAHIRRRRRAEALATTASTAMHEEVS
jgi:hypothetical protein